MNPEFIFFDEATNALDANNERIIMENLQKFFELYAMQKGCPKASFALYILYHHACALRFSGSCASTIAPNISTQPKISRADSA